TSALRGRWNAAANRGSARCPCHDDHSPSLSLSDGDKALLVHCFAGCDCRDILAALRDRGLLDEECAHRHEPRSCRTEPPPHTPDPQALAIWGAASPAERTIVQRYLRARGITIALPPSLRCAGGGLERTDPAMVAAVQAPDRRTIAVQVTQLDPSG